MSGFKRSSMFGNLPHYYDETFDENGIMGDVLVKELCPICKAHLSKSGICLNACHLSPRQREKFSQMINEVMKENKDECNRNDEWKWQKI
jgi:hypothetical protein